MSLLSTFIRTQILQALDTEFVNHVPEIQAVIVAEISDFAHECLEWAANKLDGKLESPGEKE